MTKLSVEKPTITILEQPVLLIEVEEEVHQFTWMITDATGDPKQWQTVMRGRGSDTSFRIPAEQIGQVGSYHVRVRIDETVNQAEATDPDSVPLAVIAPLDEKSHLNVSLTTPEVPRQQVNPHRFVDFGEYQKALSTARPQPVVLFGSTDSYEFRLMTALEFVRRHRVQQFVDLMPEGYLAQRVADSSYPELAKGIAQEMPAVELIWNYWQEEGMLIQTLNVILARFQNRRLPGRNPLTRFDVTPLLPLRNLLWGFAEGEMRRTTLRRRAAEYEYEYGLSLIGRAVPPQSLNVERRSAFLDAFHQVLHTAHVFYKEVDDLTVNADAYPLSQALRDCHVVLSQGSQNQYGELAVTARAEFLVLQSILAEREMREFLGGRPMTPYTEGWMDRVDSMKSIQGWDDASVMHYHDLATLGEQLVLTIRMGNWAATGVGAAQARSWALALRESVQRYTSAYRSVTGVDLTRRATAELPASLIARKVASQRSRA